MKKETSSGKKIAKIAHRLYRREMKKEAREMGKTIGNIMKPKPKYCPWFLWMWGLNLFVKIKR